MTEYSKPHVHEALGEILAALSVEKNGTLPSNLGGKSYITATDLNLEAKRKFVEHDLVLIPSEHVVHYEAINGSRLQILIVIQGTYRLVSERDGSEVEFSGIGDGVATGSAVASNIASTNALKNSLLRLFLVTEQSVEDAAKNGDESAPANSPAAAKINKASGQQKPSAPTKAPSSAGEYRTAILNAVKAGGGVADYEKIGVRLSGKPKSEWVNDVDVLSGVLDALNKGEVE